MQLYGDQEMADTKKKRISVRRRVLLMTVGYFSLALDKLEGKPTQPPKLPKPGKIKIVS